MAILHQPFDLDLVVALSRKAKVVAGQVVADQARERLGLRTGPIRRGQWLTFTPPYCPEKAAQ